MFVVDVFVLSVGGLGLFKILLWLVDYCVGFVGMFVGRFIIDYFMGFVFKVKLWWCMDMSLMFGMFCEGYKLCYGFVFLENCWNFFDY